MSNTSPTRQRVNGVSKCADAELLEERDARVHLLAPRACIGETLMRYLIADKLDKLKTAIAAQIGNDAHCEDCDGSLDTLDGVLREATVGIVIDDGEPVASYRYWTPLEDQFDSTDKTIGEYWSQVLCFEVGPIGKCCGNNDEADAYKRYCDALAAKQV